MTRKYSLVIEGDSTGYSAYVPELPTHSRDRPLRRRTDRPRRRSDSPLSGEHAHLDASQELELSTSTRLR